MATEKDLINAVKESLKADGELARIKAEMRTQIIRLLDNSCEGNEAKNINVPHDVLLLNELIREYLDWMGYKYTSTVFAAECDLPKHSFEREFLVQSLGVKESESSKSLPLLCSIIETYKKLKST